MAVPVRQGEPSGAPERWEPLHELGELRQRVDELVERLVHGGLFSHGVWSPFVDLEETDDAWVIEADLPGVRRDDVSVELRDRELAIRGELKERERTGVLHRRTRRTGRFDYRVTLAADIDPERVDASLHDGVLTVRVPKSEHAQARQIKVKGS